MTSERQPTLEDIRALLDFLPQLYSDHAQPSVTRWITETQDGSLCLPVPAYNSTVESFVDLIVKQDCWMDTSYIPEEVQRLLEDEAVTRKATIPQIRQMLTLFVRGERFCSGWRSSMIEDGHVRRLLQRLAEIEREMASAP